ncbi:MAG TPA: hypothetical protein VH062_34230 [Polyangiaceae bacterium]|jgi:hypothetical protein|nr:hypothetical protein [Polyangiaceae bacterium]
MELRFLLAGGVSALVGCVACGSSDEGSGDAANTGGASVVEAGGSLSTGGVGGTGNASGAGGVAATGAGGVPGAAGTSVTTGGSVGAGGAHLGGTTSGTGGTSTGGVGGMTASGGTGGVGGMTASGGSGGASTDDPCAGGMVGPASDKGSTTQATGYGDVEFTTSTKTQITSLETTLTVPAKPPASGTLFLWPGLEPLQNSTNYLPIGTGVLQPVLTWGSTCAPHAPNDYSSWWISAQYVNTFFDSPGHTGCMGGDGMDVAVGDPLHILMSLKGTTWSQEVTDTASGKKVTFDIDMDGQAQNWAIFSIEVPTGREPVSDIVYTSTVITLADADAAHCTPSTRGTNDFFTAPRSSPDGTKCCVAKMLLRGKGVPASGPND